MKFESLSSSFLKMDKQQMMKINGGGEDTPAGSVDINGKTYCYSSDYKYDGGCNYVITACQVVE
ncbi:MAG: hypothetical protein RBT74_00895 [Tenuifilaceae bacterium]|jgi:hypothetical protein|nr:hypothetical protein [Tenuifilaceae bacterium]